jgi:hypothetical protein
LVEQPFTPLLNALTASLYVLFSFTPASDWLGTIRSLLNVGSATANAVVAHSDRQTSAAAPIPMIFLVFNALMFKRPLS